MRIQQNWENKAVNRTVKVSIMIDVILSATCHILAISQIKYTKQNTRHRNHCKK